MTPAAARAAAASAARRCSRAGASAPLLTGGLAQHDQHLAAQQVPSGGQVGQEGGVAAGRGLQGRVRQAGRGVEQGVDARGEVDRLGPHQDLDGLGERVEQAGEAGHQRFLLGRGAQAEGDRAGPADDGQPVGAEVDDPVGADPGEREAQRRRATGRRSRPRNAGAAGTPSGAGTSRCGARWWRQAAATHRSAATPSNRPRASMAATAPTGTATTPYDGGGHDVAGGGVAGPQGDGGDSQDGELAGGQAGEQLVGPLDVGGDAHPAPVVALVGRSQPDSGGEGLGALVDDHVARPPGPCRRGRASRRTRPG